MSQNDYGGTECSSGFCMCLLCISLASTGAATMAYFSCAIIICTATA